MDRVAAMLLLLGVIVIVVLFMLALFSIAPIFCSCACFLLYILYYFLANEASGIHHAQEFENRFWTIFSMLWFSTGIFVRDSPVCFGDKRPGLGVVVVVIVSYGVHTWDRFVHRKEMSLHVAGRGMRPTQSLVKLGTMGMSVEEQLDKISLAMANIDQLLVPSTINNIINTKFIMRNERDIISVFEDAQPKALNYLISHVKLALVFYKVKDHRNYRGQHRTELIELLAVNRVSVLTIHSRMLVVRALQLLRLPAHPTAEHWVRNIITSTHQDELSELKTVMDTKGDYFCMNKLIFDDIRSETVRQDILSHFKKEAAVQQAHMDMGTRRAKLRMQKSWRKILSDVDDTLTSSGGSYPAGIDKRFTKKVVYPGVIGLYRELDLPITGTEESPPTGNLVFLSARPHLYKDVSERQNFAKFRKLQLREGVDGRGGLHTVPSLLAGDLSSGREYIMTNDFEPLARKKFDNFKRFVSIYPEYKHVFICDNGQGDVRAGEMMHDQFPRLLDGLFVHLVQDIQKTYGFAAERWRRKGLLDKTCFFRVYPDAALYAALQRPPFIRMRGLSRVCQDAVADFEMISPSQWSSESQKRERRHELNQSLWRCNKVLDENEIETVQLIETPRQWEDGERVVTSFGRGVVKSFDPVWDLYEIELDLRPLDQQVKEYEEEEASRKSPADARGTLQTLGSKVADRNRALSTVVEEEDESNYLSPATSFDASKKSSKQSLTGIDQLGRLTPSVDEENPTLPPTPESLSHEFVFDADMFDRKAAESPEPTLGDTTGTLTMEEARNLKAGNTAASSVSSSTTEQTPKKNNCLSKGKSFAKIQGKDITKFTPPILPKLPKDDKRSKFSFWASDNVKSTVDKNVEKSKTKFSPGEKVSTPFGFGLVVEHRKDQIVVVDMSGPWSARAYLQEGIVKREGAGFLGTIFGRFSSSQSSPKRKISSSAKAAKERGFPYEAGIALYSPFGEGSVIRPLPSGKSATRTQPSPPQTPSSEVHPTKEESESDIHEANTMAISLTSWTLRDGTHPTLYCSVESAEKWRNKAPATTPGHHRERSVFSVMVVWSREQ
ncbi:hypothetical protein ACHAWF_010314 [Thalassiosira exigua]